jgi:hypothetical protein
MSTKEIPLTLWPVQQSHPIPRLCKVDLEDGGLEERHVSLSKPTALVPAIGDDQGFTKKKRKNNRGRDKQESRNRMKGESAPAADQSKRYFILIRDSILDPKPLTRTRTRHATPSLD